MDEKKRIRELTDLLNEASEAYYAKDTEIMSNYTYDALYDELKELEEKTGIVFPDSPTLKVGYEAVDFLPKEPHASPMLSLAKTKSREELAAWLGDKEGLLSWKEDGLTVVLTYEAGELIKCVTRGNGEIGEVVTNNARTFINLPQRIEYKGRLVLRGEAVIGYRDFERINDSIPEEGAKYKNPRNLCSGSVRQLDSAVTAKRSVQVIIFSLVRAEGMDFDGSMEKQFAFLENSGFTVVEHERVDSSNVVEAVGRFEQKIADNDIPSDGLVLAYDDLVYAASLGRTAKFPRGAIAFKWADETAMTKLKEVEWNTSRTGLINPVAVFDTVELEGTEVSRASLHNISIIKQLKLGIGDRIMVYKANMIIPQISENLDKSDTLAIPEKCPVCGSPAFIEQEADTMVLRCSGNDCPAKDLKAYVHFVERDAMNIEGLSEATIEKLISAGLIHEFADLYGLADRKEELLRLEGFKDKAADKLVSAIEKSRKTSMARLINALGIPGIGLANAKLISKHFDEDAAKLKDADKDELSAIEGVGPVMADAFYSFMHDNEKIRIFDDLLAQLEIEKSSRADGEQLLSGKTFVITGNLLHFENRNALKAKIEELGGKVAGSVSKKTECLINNDAASSSTKNKEAKALGIRIITEDEFMAEYLT